VRCKGKTKSGERCKRQVGEGAEYCASHADQAADDPRDHEQQAHEPQDRARSEWTGEDWIDVAVDGALVLAAFAAIVIIGRWRF